MKSSQFLSEGVCFFHFDSAFSTFSLLHQSGWQLMTPFFAVSVAAALLVVDDDFFPMVEG